MHESVMGVIVTTTCMIYLSVTEVYLYSDFTVKVVDVESSSHKVYRGHKAPVLSVALDPKEQFVVGLKTALLIPFLVMGKCLWISGFYS